jgi:FKBP-type peptidyl-prolyl cis-trans isomerase
MAPKTVLDKIVHAIRSQPQTPSGVSRVSIQKYLKAELQYDNPAALKKALKKGVDSGILVQTGQSFRVGADPMTEATAELKIELEEVVTGKGEQSSQVGDTITVKYEGKLNDGTLFDAANNFEFTLGAGDVIKGWDQGLVGMKVGGKRKLVVPPKLGYGKRGCSPDIPPDSTLFFEVALKKIVRE